MRSRVYNGFVEHTRHLPVYNKFRYPVYVYGLDLDELADLDRQLPFFGYNRKRPTAIHDADYLNERPGSIRDKLLQFLPEALRVQVGRVILITSARYFNYVFNPVCFHYCFDHAGNVIQVVVEVSNTYGERHIYVPKADPAGSLPDTLRYTAPKAFHVSPFNDMSGEYVFFCSVPSTLSNTIDVKINLIREGKIVFEARLWGTGRELTRASHIRTILRHPFMPHLTMPRIIFEALRLYYRRHLTWHDKPEPKDPWTVRRKH
jgi:DUF1365 family protein